LPSFAMWSYELGRLEHSLLHAILRDLEELVKVGNTLPVLLSNLNLYV